MGACKGQDSFLADDSHVYFADGGVARVGVNGGTPAMLSPHLPRHLNHDDSYVYWATWGLGGGHTNILRLAK